MKKILIHYFTGTGNTAHAVRILGDEFSKMKWEVETVRIKGKNSQKDLTADLHVFIYPVYALSFPHAFAKYIKSLRNESGVKTAIIANHGMANLKGGINTGYEGNGPAHVAAILKRKNFDVFFTGAAGYPENITILANAVPDDVSEEIIRAADEKIRNFAVRMSGFEISIKKYNFFESIISMSFGFVFRHFGRRHFGKFYSADDDCTGCGACVKACPVNAIRMFNKKPGWNWNCEGCFCCFNLCPEKAINISIAHVFLLFAAGFALLGAMTAFYGRLYNLFLGALTEAAAGILKGNPGFFISAIIVYFILYFMLVYLLDKIMFILEQVPYVRKIFQLTYTKKLRRYICPDYKPAD